jgi:oligopeptidase B
MEAPPDRPPVAERRPHVHREHGVSRDDPWFWLRDRGDPAVRALVEAENRWSEARMAPLAPVREKLYAEFLSRVQETDASVPAPWGPWAYYARTEHGKAYAIHCRRSRGGRDGGGGGGEEQILLDVNRLAEGQAFTSVAAIEPSPDHRVLGFCTDFTAEERYTLRFRDLASGQELADELPNCSGSFTWADARTVWFCTLDDAMRSHRVWRYVLGSRVAPVLVVDEPDEGFRLGVSRTRSGRFLRVQAMNPATTETWLARADDAASPLRTVLPRRRGQKYTVAHAGESLFVNTNVGADDVPGSAVNHRLLEIPLRDGVPAVAEAVERIAHRDHVELVRIDGFANHLAIVERDRGQLELRILDLRDGGDDRVPLPERPSVVDLGANHEWDRGVVRFDYGSLTTPSTDYDVDLDTFELTRLKEQPVPGYDRTRYRTERLEAVAPDGTRIPMSVVYPATLDLRAGPHPTLLYGYGAYGITIDPAFSQTRVSMLDRGVVCAIAHVRGGGFLGRGWYEAGKLHHKANSFHDFVACGRHLVQLGITAPDRLVSMGGSAGGLLVGAAMNLAPDLFRGVLAPVPFVDVVTTMFDTTLPLTIPEFDEWGNPAEKPFFDTIYAYSPYDNVKPGPYPDLLATAGWSDPRVQFWEPLKWVQRLRERATAGEFLVHIELGAGHQGPSGRYGALEHRALEYAWVLGTLGRAV